jgi:DNA-binding transcriptional ArsR family regulator
MSDVAMAQFLEVAAALADENRVRALLALRGGELCACQVIELLGLAPSTVSKHLAVLRQAGLVAARKEGRWMYYRLPDAAEAPEAVRRAIDWACEALGKGERVRADVRRLCGIVKEDPGDLCKRQAARSRCCSSAPATRAGARWRRAGLAT